ncbi:MULTISPECIES: DUF4240 domain-containing protein [Actinosynnema]|uniref:DUF4240 domain-containing protein n=1 Tax=Actinosynnema TaxID=40566 RepID=UPI0020A3B663|nr:DUF4240 domain-containing protein [Actinosynnema pretiosum]MCP2097199.1 Protein of unknown function (DUF4240) [Actinosynnema pretiosum]
MDENGTWELLERVWAGAAPEALAAREALLTGGGDRVEAAAVLEAHLPGFLARLREACEGASSAELAAHDAVVERALWELDREDVHAVLDGSDDGFLYARGFVVALGRRYWEAVLADPEVGVEDAECERMCYFFAHLHDEAFGGWPPRTGISRETGSNAAGWA